MTTATAPSTTMPPTTAEQDAHGLAQRPVPPPAALDLDRGAVEPAPSRSGQTPGAPRPSRPARTSRGAQAGATQARGSRGDRAAAVAPAPAPSRELGRQQAAGGLVVPVQLRGFRWVLHACVAAVTAAPGRAAVIGAHRGADASARRRRGTGRLRGRHRSPLPGGGIPGCPSPWSRTPGRSRRLLRCPDSPRRPPGDRAQPCPRRDTERQSHQLCCSRVLAGGSEVAASGNATST